MDQNMNRELTRRKFLKKSALGASAALAFPAIVSPRVLGANDTVQLGTIGCGGRGSADMEALAAVTGARIAAVCELRDDRLEKAKQIAGTQPTPYKDFRQMIEKEKLDGVSAVVEVQNHAKVIVPVLEAGINCFSEKPMDNTVEKVDAMVLAARKSKGFLQVGFQRRYIPGHRAVLERIHKEELGKIYALQGHWHFSHHAGPEDADWDGGRLIEQACHHMDVMNWVMKNTHPIRCIAMGLPPSDVGPNPPKHMSEAKSSIAFEFPGNVLFSYTHLFGVPGPFGDERGNFTGEKLWVICERGGYDITRGMKYVLGGAEEQVGQPSAGYYEGTREEFAAFVECCRTGQKPASNHETARISTFMSIMGRMAMYNRDTASFTPRLIRWEDLGSKT